MNSLLLAYAGTEELDQSGLVQAEVEAVAEEVAKVEVAEATLEIHEIAEEVSDISERLEELEEAHEELEETVEGMESLMASGSYNAGAFAHMYRRAGVLSAKLGGKSGHRQGVESFGDASTAAIAARDGMEAFGDTVKGYAKTAIEFIKSLFNRLIAFVVGLWDTAKGLDKRIAHLTERLGKAELKADAKVKLGGWNTLLDIAINKAPSKLTPGDNTKVYGSVLGATFAAEVERAMGKGDASTLVSSFSTAYKAIVSGLSTGKEVTGGDSDSTGRLTQYGAWRVLVTFFKGDIAKVEDCIEALKALKFSFTKDSEAAKKLVGESVNALAKTELAALLTSAKSTVTDVQKAKLEDKFSTSRRDKIVGLLNVATKDAEDKKDSNLAAKFIKQYCTTSGNFLTTFTKAQLKVAEAKINCVAAHV